MSLSEICSNMLSHTQMQWRRPPLLSKKPNVIQTGNSRQQDALC